MPHELHPRTKACLGCGEVSPPLGDECPAFYAEIGPSLRLVVGLDEDLTLWVGKGGAAEIVRFDRSEAFAIKDALVAGIRDLRTRSVSRAAPAAPVEWGSE